MPASSKKNPDHGGLGWSRGTKEIYELISPSAHVQRTHRLLLEWRRGGA